MKELPRRKQIRLKGYDYSRNGAYFITLCVKDRAELLGNIKPAHPLVGGGVPDAPHCVLDAPHCKLSPYGDAVPKRIADMCRHYENIEIPHYVIMPNHVHMIILVSDNGGNGTSGGDRGTSNENRGTSRTPSPTNAVIPALVSTLKRRIRNRTYGGVGGRPPK